MNAIAVKQESMLEVLNQLDKFVDLNKYPFYGQEIINEALLKANQNYATVLEISKFDSKDGNTHTISLDVDDFEWA